MSNESKTENERPLWQTISGIDPKREAEMSADERDAGIRKLVAEVRTRAAVEFEREDLGKIPEGERSIFWDPLQRICGQLGISRTKLSSYSRELTGLRAHELSDEILAKRRLQGRLECWVKMMVGPELELMRGVFSKARIDLAFKRMWGARFAKWLKGIRSSGKGSFAATMGFANYSRLSRACLIAFGKALDHMELDLVVQHVQKFLETEGLTQRREERKEQQQKKESVLTAEAQKIIDEAVKATVGGMPGKKYLVA
jgi:hypothetical protein